MDDKKNVEKRRGFKRYVDSKAFYGVLALGILVVCVTGMLAGRQGAELAKKEFNTNKGPSVFNNLDGIRDLSQNSLSVTPVPNKKGDDGSVTVKKSTNEAQAFAKVETKKTPSPTSLPGNFKLIYPVQGIILNPFSHDVLIFNKTLGDFRTHCGIDIGGSVTTAVKAAADGYVTKVYKDDTLGISIIIDHGSGLMTKYANLSTDTMVKVGSIVKTGDVISGIGESAPFESADGAHLHFEVIKNDIPINPDLYLVK